MYVSMHVCICMFVRKKIFFMRLNLMVSYTFVQNPFCVTRTCTCLFFSLIDTAAAAVVSYRSVFIFLYPRNYKLSILGVVSTYEFNFLWQFFSFHIIIILVGTYREIQFTYSKLHTFKNIRNLWGSRTHTCPLLHWILQMAPPPRLNKRRAIHRRHHCLITICTRRKGK